MINGSTPGEKRLAIVDAFAQSGDRFGVLLLSPKAAGIGLNIVAANHVIHLSRWWNPAIEDQCNDRAYRIGQTKPVTGEAFEATPPPARVMPTPSMKPRPSSSRGTNG